MFTIPDKGEAVNDVMSILFQEYIDAIVENIDGKNVVLSGFGATSNSNMTYSIAKGSVLTNGVLKAVAAGTATVTTANGTNPRLDLIVIDSSGALQVRAGTAAANPKPPARTSNDVLLYCVYVPANDTSLAANQLVDLRITRSAHPITLYKTTTAETTNTTSSAVHVLDKTNSGVVMPNGLFLSGKQLRCRIGGNFLLNSGTPTITLAIAYGGTTMFQDVTGTATADTDRLAWFLDFQINAQANNDQSLSGTYAQSILGAKTAPTNGIGDIAGTAALVNAFAGSAAVDSDAANRTLTVTITMSVNNAANEIVTEFATLELL